MQILPNSASGNSFKFLGLLILVFLLLIFLGVFYYFPTVKKQEQLESLTAISFSNQAQEQQYKDFLERGLNGQKKSFDDLNNAFITLRFEYLPFPSEEKRNKLLELASYVKENFADQYAKGDFSVPCRQESCGAVAVYSDDAAKIKKGIEEISAISQNNKKSMFFDLETYAYAAGEGNKSLQVTSLSGVFFDLKMIWEESGDVQVKQLAQDVLELMKNTVSSGQKAIFETKTYSLDL